MLSRSSAVSLRSSLMESVEENGRTYHKYKDGRESNAQSLSEWSNLTLHRLLFP
jgi:hypothetical protein